MKFAIITHAPHIIKDGIVYAYGPYVREMNLWVKNVDKVLVVAPVEREEPSKIHLPYDHDNVVVLSVPAISLISFTEVFKALFALPIIKLQVFWAMLSANHIHLRCPGNIGLIGCFVQIFFPRKTKTAKYAGNWDPKSKQPLSYRLQKWILGNTFLSHNLKALVYGEWSNQSKNVVPFFTATYPSYLKSDTAVHSFESPFTFTFVGALAPGKRPLYAVQLIEALNKEGFECTLNLYGEGAERKSIETYVNSNNLAEAIQLHGNQTAETVQAAYHNSDFLILPSKSEGWPKVVAEAMFWGTIPLVTKISCVPWMLGEGNRGIFLSTDLLLDINEIKNFLGDKTRLKQMSADASEWSRRYTLDTFENEISKLVKL